MTENGPSEPSGDGPPVYPDRPPSPPSDEIEDTELVAEMNEPVPVAVVTSDAEEDDAEAPPTRRLSEGGPPWPLIIGWLVVIALAGILAFLLGSNSDEEDTPTTDTSATDTSTPGTGNTTDTSEVTPLPVPEDFIEYTDEATGFSMSYPEDWDRLELPPEDPTIRLIVSAGGFDSILVRVLALEDPVSPETMTDLNNLTDGIIGGADIEIFQELEVDINGMPGFYYLYTFNEPTTGQEGAHAHYFLFKERTMNIIVFQGVPTARFQALAPTFDAVAQTIESNPPETPPSTEPPAEDITTTTLG